MARFRASWLISVAGATPSKRSDGMVSRHSVSTITDCSFDLSESPCQFETQCRRWTFELQVATSSFPRHGLRLFLSSSRFDFRDGHQMNFWQQGVAHSYHLWSSTRLRTITVAISDIESVVADVLRTQLLDGHRPHNWRSKEIFPTRLHRESSSITVHLCAVLNGSERSVSLEPLQGCEVANVRPVRTSHAR